MRSALTVLNEQIKNFYLVRRLSAYEMKSSNNDNYLGILWEIINPMIQIAIYWYVFGFIMPRSDIGDDPYFPWLLAGISVWFLISPSITLGSKAIYSRLNMISKMSFPVSVIPTYVILAKFYQHLMLLAAVIIILAFSGYPPTFYIVQLPYFLFATLAFLVSLSLITSTLTTIIRDVQMVIQSLMRVLLYLTPILWFKDKWNPAFLGQIMRANPLYYIVEGYRAALLGHSWYLVDHYKYTLYFWVLTIVLFIIGSALHLRFRDRFVDFK
ncbi:ABC transporter permease [Peribacillus sp. B-H-3]|jgi:teichoic acid transport system permease protein|uniref:ABC transporter permease n=1 Tax=Peribacillus sp. B-H-3 TaxID=3400420 RepID=UPI003B02DE9E